ncbi:type II toxin-antitoxin system PemK/MazF family toxin [Paenibacillus naphthalenovorans]|uniref:mRNA interferase n=1 Tax=Paenibacillus naphthalenovorans TaxID=162209 RepID=A0A0U2IM88_9BACL|nr:type II toxin-antitoxin system PemK/MazF family toxin [Paenibacillus naphthalenovorans]ALS22251.1 mRNA interferase PemK [Paenibacillus naphthalenovorans]
MITNEYKKFDIWMADLSGVVGSEQGGSCRPVLIVSNNVGNKFSPVVTIAVLTSRLDKTSIPTHVFLDAQLNGLDRDSLIMLEQLRTVDKNRLFMKVSRVHPSLEKEINKAIKISLDTEDEITYFERGCSQIVNNLCFA